MDEANDVYGSIVQNLVDAGCRSRDCKRYIGLTLVGGISAKRLKIIENKLDKEDANEENT